MLDILATIPRKKRHSSSGWIVFDGICCHHRGHNPDRRSRAGIKFSDTDSWSYHCFNCQFKCGYVLGKQFPSSLKQLLTWCGIDSTTIDKMSFESFRHGSVLELYKAQPKLALNIEFSTKELPPGSRLLDPNVDTLHVEYLRKRGLTSEDYTFYINEDDIRKRIIIPYYFNGKIVGNTSRYYDSRHPKYISDQQKGYVFNIDNQKSDYEVCILVEGQFDAISINGCAFMSNSISDEQAQLLRKLHRKIIFVPDRDKTGMNVCDRAIDLGFQVSIPKWSSDIKDVNDAVVKYGKLPTLMSILQSSTSSKIIVEMNRKKLV